MMYNIIKIHIVFLILLFSNTVSAQITVTDNQTAQQLVNKLIGENVAIFNPVLTCDPTANGIFDAPSTSVLGLKGGIVLATGAVNTNGTQIGVNGGGWSGGPAITPVSTPGDTDLYNLIKASNPSTTITYSGCVLEFDFVPDIDTTSTLKFKYVFGSEEYPQYTCSNFNDVFGFLITGAPSYNKTNIALVPGTNIPVAINSVNGGSATGSGNFANCTNMGPGSPFPAYFINNQSSTSDLRLPGITTVLEALATVEPCSTYHMKLGVANANDAALQSAVFLLEKSFSVDSVHLNLADIITSDSGYIAEGCGDAKMTIVRDTTTNTVKKLCFDYGGTATYGVDYDSLPYLVFIPPKQYDTTFPIIPFQDGIPELPYETIIIRRLNCCTMTPVDSVELRIYDSLQITLFNKDTGICGSQTINLRAAGDGDFNYQWSPSNIIANPTDSFTTATVNTTTTFTVTASFMNCPDVSKSFTTIFEPIPEVDILNSQRNICLGIPLQLLAQVEPDDYSDYTYLWTPSTGLDDPTLLEPSFFVTNAGIYSFKLTATTATLGCTGSDTISFDVKPAAKLIDVTPDFTLKYGDEMQLNASGAVVYTWSPTEQLSNPNINNPTVIAHDPALFTVIGFNEYGCADTAYVKMNVDYAMQEFLPNAFSPNGDGRNDVFSVKNLKFQSLIEFKIYNRYGNEVFSTNDSRGGWDGTYMGVPQEIGVYNYIVRVAHPDGTQRVYKGTITLLR